MHHGIRLGRYCYNLSVNKDNPNMSIEKYETPIPWLAVDVWVSRGSDGGSKLLEHGSEEHVLALDEYRCTGAIAGCYLVAPNDDPYDDSDCFGGPSIKEIDWTGLADATLIARAVFDAYNDTPDFDDETP